MLFQNPSSFFSTSNNKSTNRRFVRDRYTGTISRYNLYGNSTDLQFITDRWSRIPVGEFNGSRVGAYFPWPPNKAGERVQKHLVSESPESMFNTELTRRPPTNLPGRIRMAFGRAAPGYYAERFPSKNHVTENTL
ncbi:unnamed protein product [Dicrocoelium dendriticum]|nr:unnamed protein product [Dicrocoelium dendriticum]